MRFSMFFLCWCLGFLLCSPGLSQAKLNTWEDTVVDFKSSRLDDVYAADTDLGIIIVDNKYTWPTVTPLTPEALGDLLTEVCRPGFKGVGRVTVVAGRPEWLGDIWDVENKHFFEHSPALTTEQQQSLGTAEITGVDVFLIVARWYCTDNMPEPFTNVKTLTVAVEAALFDATGHLLSHGLSWKTAQIHFGAKVAARAKATKAAISSLTNELISRGAIQKKTKSDSTFMFTDELAWKKLTLTELQSPYSECLTFLHKAVQKGSSEQVTDLLKRGANPDVKGPGGHTPLHLAVLSGSNELINILLENGASPDVSDRFGYTPLHLAVKEGSSDLVEKFLDNRADASAIDLMGYSPLSYAIHNQNWPIVDLLVEAGANNTVKLPCVPLDLEFEWSQEMKEQHVIWAVRADDHSTANKMIDEGEPFNYVDGYGWSPLHWAAFKGSTDTVELLLDRGIPADTEAKDGSPPLHLAALKRHWKVAALLIKAGAKPKKKNNAGRDAYHFAGPEFRKLHKVYKKNKP